jgi:hypothetical protein
MDIAVPGNKNFIQLLKDLVDCTTIITDNILLFDKGKYYSYKVVAGQLRLLLCDISKRSKRNNSLILKIFPNIKLHPLSFSLEDAKKSLKGRLILFSPGTLTTNSKRIYDIFNIHAEPISLEQWLNQNILDEEITISKLITSVANIDGGAHVDQQLDRVLRKTMSGSTNEIEDNKIYIVEIGRYIVEIISKHLLNIFKLFQSKMNDINNI